VGFVPVVTSEAKPVEFYLHTGEPDLTLLGGANMGAGRALARGGDLHGGPAGELIVGAADGAWVVDVSATLVPGVPTTVDLSAAAAVHLQSVHAGPYVGLVVGALKHDGEAVVWVGDGGSLHLFHSPPASGAVPPDVELIWVDPAASARITAATSASWGALGEQVLVVGCSQCSSLDPNGPVAPGVVRAFDVEDLLGPFDLPANASLTAVSGTVANGRFGQSLAAFSNGRVVIGAAGGHGAVHVTDAGSLTLTANLPGSNSARTGWSVAVGDPDASGTEDLVAGGPEALFGGDRYGMIRAGTEDPFAGPIPSPWYMQGPGGGGSPGAKFGQSVAVGDINGDTFDDVIVGAPRAMDTWRTGLVYVILGGLPGGASSTTAQMQYLDPDGDGAGAGDPSLRCGMVGALLGGDCDNNDPARAPNKLELCSTVIDDDCLDANNALCNGRIKTIDVDPYTDLTDSLWCYEDMVWKIGPRAADTVSIQDLAEMVLNETLFFDDTLDHGVAGAVDAASACAGHNTGPSIILDVISRTSGGVPLTDEDWANSRYDRVLSAEVVDRLRDNKEGYLIGAWNIETAGAPKFVILGGDYPGLVNGVVDLLRATEGGPGEPRAPWKNATVLDWPENPRRILRSSLPLLGCNSAGDNAAIDPAEWAGCTAVLDANDDPALQLTALDARNNLDLALRYHYNTTRVGNQMALLARLGSSLRVTSYQVEEALYLRRRGIDASLRWSLLPQSPEVNFDPDTWSDIDPNAVEWMPHAVVASIDPPNTRYGFPCDSVDCEPEVPGAPAGNLSFTVADHVFNEKYWMPLTGSAAGVVHARDMIRGDIISDVACDLLKEVPDPAAIADICTDGPCFCTNRPPAASPSREADIAGDEWLVLPLADRTFDKPLVWSGDPHDDWTYSLWGKRAFRPGRLYALHLTATSTDTLTLEVSLDGSGHMITKAAFSPTLSTHHISFVIRAPLQLTETVEGLEYGAGEPFAVSPALRIAITHKENEPPPPGEIHISNLSVVELDGLSTEWMKHDDGTFALELDKAQVVPVDAPGAIAPCPVGLDGCVPYETTSACDLGLAYGPGVGHERFSNQASPVLTAEHILKLQVNDPSVERVSVNGVQKPIMGSFTRDVCGTSGRTSTAQTYEVFSPDNWRVADGTQDFPATVRKFSQPGLAPDGHSVRDFLWGEEVGNSFVDYRWHDTSFTYDTTVFSEVRFWNRGYAAWRDHIYEPIPQSELVRAISCHTANLVNRSADPSWADGLTHAGRSYCDWAAPGEICGPGEMDLLSEAVVCPLVGAETGHRVAFDTNMFMDSATNNAAPFGNLLHGSLDTTYFHAPFTEQCGGEPCSPSGATVASTLAPNVDTIHWEYSADSQDRLEAMCDIQNISDYRPEGDYFLGHSAVGADLLPNPTSRNACIQSGKPARPSTVTGLASISTVAGGNGTTRFGPDGVRLWATLAAGMKDVIGALEVNIFDGNGSGGADLAKPEEPFWGYAARCMWNPEWEHLATVSLDLAHSGDKDFSGVPYVAGRWCRSGSAWAGAESFYNQVGNVGNSQYHTSCGDAPPGDAGAPGNQLWLDDNDCVAAFRNRALRMAIRPELDAMVVIPPGNEGRRIRASTVAGYEVTDFPEPAGCAVARGFVERFHPDSAPVRPLPMSGSVRGRIFFADAAGDVLVPGGTPLAADCTTQALTLGDDHAALIRPRHGEFFGPSNAFISVDAEIPEGAKYVGVVFEFPSTPDPDDPIGFPSSETPYTHAVMASVSFGLETWRDPGVTPGASPQSSTAYNNPNLSYPNLALPRSCTESYWYTVSEWKADETSLPDTRFCFKHFSTSP
jgi:hypothetical protein